MPEPQGAAMRPAHWQWYLRCVLEAWARGDDAFGASDVLGVPPPAAASAAASLLAGSASSGHPQVSTGLEGRWLGAGQLLAVATSLGARAAHLTAVPEASVSRLASLAQFRGQGAALSAVVGGRSSATAAATAALLGARPELPASGPLLRPVSGLDHTAALALLLAHFAPGRSPDLTAEQGASGSPREGARGGSLAPPVYLQWAGHSVVAIGAGLADRVAPGATGAAVPFVVVFDSIARGRHGVRVGTGGCVRALGPADLAGRAALQLVVVSPDGARGAAFDGRDRTLYGVGALGRADADRGSALGDDSAATASSSSSSSSSAPECSAAARAPSTAGGDDHVAVVDSDDEESAAASPAPGAHGAVIDLTSPVPGRERPDGAVIDLVSDDDDG